LVYDVNAFPWVPKVPGVAVDGTQNWIYGSTDFELFVTTLERAIGDISINPTAVSVGGSAIVHLTAPRGSVIKGFSVKAVCLVGATLSITLRKIDNLGVNTNVVVVSAVPGAGIQTISSGAALTEMISTTADYYIEVNLVADGTTKTSAILYSVDVAYKLAGTP
jgi:hypothetical protein